MLMRIAHAEPPRITGIGLQHEHQNTCCTAGIVGIWHSNDQSHLVERIVTTLEDLGQMQRVGVLNRGEAINALKRVIYTGRMPNYQAKREDEMQAVADGLS